MLSVNTAGQIVFYLGLLINVVIFIPQMMKLWRSKDSKNVSFITFLGFLLLQLIIVFHGISIGDIFLTTAYLLSTLACAAVLTLIFFYQLKQKYTPTLNQPVKLESVDYQEAIERLDLLENIIALMPGHVYWLDKNGVYLGCNDAQAKSAGFASRQAIVGLRSKDAPWSANAESAVAFWESINAQVMSEGKIVIVEEPAMHMDGSHAIYLSNKAPLYNRQREIIGMVGISIDITERKQIEQDLIQAKAEAAANQTKTEFLYNMKHDLRTPFSGILGIAEYMEGIEDDPVKKTYLNDIAQSAKILLTHLNEIFDFINASQGSMPIIYKQFDLRTLAHEVYKMLLPAAKEKKIALTMDIDDQIPQFLIGDRVRTQRILLNIVSNAIKFTQQGSVNIKAEASKIEGNKFILKFSVIDTGIGIPEDKQDLVFEQFSRLTPSYNGTYHGKGLGLRMAKHFLDEIGGEIFLKSAINKGSTFKILIPYRTTLLNCSEDAL